MLPQGAWTCSSSVSQIMPQGLFGKVKLGQRSQLLPSSPHCPSISAALPLSALHIWCSAYCVKKEFCCQGPGVLRPPTPTSKGFTEP